MKRPLYDLYARDFCLNLGAQTKIMGIMNLTPDSFSGDGRLSLKQKITTETHLRYAKKLIADGADILDVGGESTRPGARSVSKQEELKRVIPAIKVLASNVKIPISIDTYKLEVARQALDAGASIVNNIQGTSLNKSFLKMVRDYKASIVLMHMRGNSATMQAKAKYKNVTEEVIKELKDSLEKCLEIGINKDRIIVDPGIGFAKNFEQNLILMNQLDRLHRLHCPILLGVSRKSFIGQILQKDADQRLLGTCASVAVGVERGAHIVRVHDVKAVQQTIMVTDAILQCT